jgi:hypothetical protein
MIRSMENRYVTRSQILALPTGALYNGEDLALKREVTLYIIDKIEGGLREEYLRKFKKASAFTHEGFQHILDTAIEEQSLFIVLQHRSGKPLIKQLRQQTWTFKRIITLISDLGVSILDGMEEQITGFSVGAENLWLGEDGRLSVINYWEEGESQTVGALGLCNLMIQLFSGLAQIPDPFKALDTYLFQIGHLQASSEQKEALIKLVSRIYQGQASLSTLVFGLQGLSNADKPAQEETFIPSAALNASSEAKPQKQQQSASHYSVLDNATEDEDEEEAKVPLYKRKSLIVSGILLVCLLIYFMWPSHPPAKDPSLLDSAKPEQSATTGPAVESAQPTPASDNSGNSEGQDIIMPDLIGMTQADAEKKALASGLHYSYQLEAHSEPKDTVFKQDPEAGTKVVKGDKVTFWVSKGGS